MHPNYERDCRRIDKLDAVVRRSAAKGRPLRFRPARWAEKQLLAYCRDWYDDDDGTRWYVGDLRFFGADEPAATDKEWRVGVSHDLTDTD